MNQNLLLCFLVLLYISNQWARCSFPFLGNVAPPIQCTKACRLGSTGGGYAENSLGLLYIPGGSLLSNHSKYKAPLCPSFNCGKDDICTECQACLTENNFQEVSLSYATCLSPYQYGFLSSYGYTIAFVIFTMIGSQIAGAKGQTFRKYLIFATAVGWAAATVLQGLAKNYFQLLVSRILLGAFEAVSTPFSYALIADVFHPNELASKNGLFTIGVYLGGALGSLSIIFTKWLGYKLTCDIISLFSLCSAIGLSCISFEIDKELPLEELLLQKDDTQPESTVNVKEVEIKQENILETKESLSDSLHTKEREKIISLWTDSTLWFLYIGAGLRLFGGFSLASYGPVFYARRFPADNVTYGTLNAGITMIFGALSAYYGGVLSDYFTLKYDERYKAYVPALGCLLGFVPVVVMLFTASFEVSIFCLGAQTLLSECWMASGIAILQKRADSQTNTAYTKERALSLYMFTGTLIGSLGPFIIGVLDDGKSYESIRISLFMTLGISYIGAALFFFLLGGKVKPSSSTENL